MSSTSSDDRELARHLVRLARNGAYARPASDDADAHYQVRSPRNNFAAPIATLTAAAVARALALGWVAQCADVTIVLSRRGRRALLREITTPTAGPVAARRAPTQTAHASPDTACRTPQRIDGPLAWLRKRKDRSGVPLITQAQFEAGERLAADYGRAQMQARVTASWSAAAPCLRAQTPGVAADITDAALAARDRFHRAIAVVGPEMGLLLVDVCCHDIGLEAAERARRWPVRSGKVVLEMGLTALARHYGLMPATADETRDRSSAPRPRRWAEAGYVPTLDVWA